MTKLGNYSITCYQPKSETVKIGKIGPIGLETNPDDIKELLIEKGHKSN